jgi:hypothetical protein
MYQKLDGGVGSGKKMNSTVELIMQRLLKKKSLTPAIVVDMLHTKHLSDMSWDEYAVEFTKRMIPVKRHFHPDKNRSPECSDVFRDVIEPIMLAWSKSRTKREKMCRMKLTDDNAPLTHVPNNPFYAMPHIHFCKSLFKSAVDPCNNASNNLLVEQIVQEIRTKTSSVTSGSYSSSTLMEDAMLHLKTAVQAKCVDLARWMLMGQEEDAEFDPRVDFYPENYASGDRRGEISMHSYTRYMFSDDESSHRVKDAYTSLGEQYVATLPPQFPLSNKAWQKTPSTIMRQICAISKRLMIQQRKRAKADQGTVKPTIRKSRKEVSLPRGKEKQKNQVHNTCSPYGEGGFLLFFYRLYHKFFWLFFFMDAVRLVP